jgi:hypothetical protein
MGLIGQRGGPCLMPSGRNLRHSTRRASALSLAIAREMSEHAATELNIFRAD